MEKNLAKKSHHRRKRQEHTSKMVKQYMSAYDKDGNGVLDRSEVKALATKLLDEYTPLLGGLTDDDIDLIMRCGGDTRRAELKASELPHALAVMMSVRDANQSYHDLFRRFDTSGNGKLDPAELGALLTEIGEGVTPSAGDIDYILKQCEPRGVADPLEERDLKAAIACWYCLKPSAPDQIKALFKQWDTTGDGVITKTELGAVMRKLNADLTDAELDVVFSSVDSNSNGVIDYNEFVDWALHSGGLGKK